MNQKIFPFITWRRVIRIVYLSDSPGWGCRHAPALWLLRCHLSCTWEKSKHGRGLIMACKRMLIVFIAMLKRAIGRVGFIEGKFSWKFKLTNLLQGPTCYTSWLQFKVLWAFNSVACESFDGWRSFNVTNDSEHVARTCRESIKIIKIFIYYF